MRDITPFLSRLKNWLAARGDVRGVVLVGSYARGTAEGDSDIDLVLLCETPNIYLHDERWVAFLGAVLRVEMEGWGPVQSRRVFYKNGLEVEFGIAAPEWARIDPLDEGTSAVVRDGAKILHDPQGILERLISAVHGQQAGF